MEEMEMEDEIKSFLKAIATILASLSYSYFISSKLPRGTPRFLSLLPIISLFTFLPLSLDLHSPLSLGFLSGFISFLANFKLISFSFNSGPLSKNPNSSSLLRFVLFAALPVKIKRNPSPPSAVFLPLNLGLKTLISAVLLVLYRNLGRRNLLVFCCWMYLFNDVALGLCRILVGAVLRVELESPSDEPYVASSLQDFWGNRWNRTASDALRYTVYKPVRSLTGQVLGLDWGAGPALLATFVVSGLMHELVFYHVTRVRPTWEVTWFFVLHGVCVVVEVMVKRRLGGTWKLKRAVSGLLTVGFVVISGYWLFFPQIMRSNVDIGVMEDVVAICNFVKDTLINICHYFFCVGVFCSCKVRVAYW